MTCRGLDHGCQDMRREKAHVGRSAPNVRVFRNTSKHSLNHERMSATESPTLTVYYDGACPVCRREIALWQRSDGADQLCWIDASESAAELGDDLERSAALTRMHVRDAEGRLIAGAAAFAALWRAFPRTRWLGRIAGNRVALFFLEPAYRLFLKVRPLWRRG